MFYHLYLPLSIIFEVFAAVLLRLSQLIFVQ